MYSTRMYVLLAALLLLGGCKKNEVSPDSLSQNRSFSKHYKSTLNPFFEDFETGTKTSYTSGNVALGTGTWTLNDALIGNSTSDAKSGTQSVRVRNSGKVTMAFDKAGGVGTVSVQHGIYGSDASGSWQLWYSVNGGGTYVQAGSTVSTTSGTLQTASFPLNISGNIRFEMRKTDAGTNRLNFDNISISDYVSSNPAPSLTSISPNSCTAGAASFTLTANGNNFINGSVIQWNGVALTTTYVSSAQLRATVPSANVSAAGSATVTVSTPSPGGGVSGGVTFTINAAAVRAKKFLFDATHAETAGNADWVIDEDNSTPQRTPTPLQSTITSTTGESYWTGALSSWGIALVKLGHTVETLPGGGKITYGNSSNAQDLSRYDVFVVDEPNTRFTSSEKTAILQFVKNGGSLLMIADHTQSDRNNDGWDSPAIWNDLMSNNSVQSNPFGFSIDLANVSGTSSNVSTVSANTVLYGSQGTVSTIQFANGTTLSLSSTNTNVKGLVWESGYAQSTTHVMCATSLYGTGRVFVIGDSSPEDDGTGAPNNLLYDGWHAYSHSSLLLNASLWLAKVQ